MIRVAIVGLGVIGGSLGMALTAGNRYHVVGIDKDPMTLEAAEAVNAVSEVTGDIYRGVRSAQIVVLALPVTDIIRTAALIRNVVPSQAIITDVGSTKGKVVAALEDIYSERFIGGHPMTGSEYAGIKGADRYLFENAIYVLTPTSRTSPRAIREIKELVAETGARILCLSPQEHDLIVTAVSHLPHLLAVSLMNLAGELAQEHPETLLLAAGGFRDMTRVAASHSLMWRDIYASNRENIVNTCQRLRELLLEIEENLVQEKYDDLVAGMEQARQERAKISPKIRGILPAVYEVAVTVPDRPGSIARFAGVLGEQGINIMDLEILRVREGEGGTIRLSFRTAVEADQAVQVLQVNGYPVQRR